jgi:hypothetical protein
VSQAKMALDFSILKGFFVPSWTVRTIESCTS